MYYSVSMVNFRVTRTFSTTKICVSGALKPTRHINLNGRKSNIIFIPTWTHDAVRMLLSTMIIILFSLLA
jgi:hypothetical protein